MVYNPAPVLSTILMKEQTREIGLGDVLHFPSDIQYLTFHDRVLAVAVVTANWLVLPSKQSKFYLENLRKGSSIGEVLNNISNPEEKQQFIKLLSAIMARQFAGINEVPKPKYVQGYRMLNIYLTNACNLRCPHCFMKAGKRLQDELNCEDWKRVLKDFRECGGETVTFTGGEPLMNPAFREIIETAYQEGLQITVLTNGILWTDELIDEMSPKLAEVQISIDGTDDASNAKIRAAGTFETLVNNVIRFSNNGVRTSVATTFTNDNIDSAAQYAELINRINEATNKKVIFNLTKKILPGRETQYTDEENQQYERRIRQIEEQIDANAKFVNFMEGHRPNLAAENCGFGGVSISANGNVYFCNRVLEVCSQGNVKDMPLADFLRQGESAHHETDVNHVEPCRTCAIRYICGGGCRIDEYDFKGRDWKYRQLFKQEKCSGLNPHLLRMMVDSFENNYMF